MPIIYLRHPVHGAKVATMDAEAAYDESNGWKRYDPAPLAIVSDPPPVVIDPLPVDEPVNAMAPAPHPLDHDGDGKPGGSLPGPRRRRRTEG